MKHDMKAMMKQQKETNDNISESIAVIAKALKGMFTMKNDNKDNSKAGFQNKDDEYDLARKLKDLEIEWEKTEMKYNNLKEENKDLNIKVKAMEENIDKVMKLYDKLVSE